MTLTEMDLMTLQLEPPSVTTGQFIFSGGTQEGLMLDDYQVGMVC